jgi:predicted RNA-binding protein
MCEAHAYILKDGQEERIMESVDRVEIESGEVKMINIYGEQKIFKARFRAYDNRQGKILFELTGDPSQ